MPLPAPQPRSSFPNWRDGLSSSYPLFALQPIRQHLCHVPRAHRCQVLDLVPATRPGSHHHCPIRLPANQLGKGFGHFDVQGTLGVALPTSNESTAGRMYTWNNAFQYQLLRRLWPELEVNATFFQDGNNDGQNQVLITPGLIVGRLPLTSRLSLVLGAGVQIAASEFHTTQHNFILTVRLPF